MVKEFGSYVLPKFVVHSAEIELAASKLCSVYELPPSSKKTYLRAKESLDAAFNEILEAILTVWQKQDADRTNEARIKGEELENVY